MIWGLLLLVFWAVPVMAQTYPGGFVEATGSTARARMGTATIAGFVPAGRGSFTFPAPYNTRGYRITTPADCTSGQDCVEYVGYSYWPMMNNHVADSFLYLVIALRDTRGGAGLTLFKLEKATGTVTKVGNLCPASLSGFQTSIFSETWYFSFTLPYTLYITDFASLLKYDVQTQAMTTAFTILNRSYTTSSNTLVSLGCTSTDCPRRLYQFHSVANDTIHVGTLIQTQTGGADVDMGCLVYNATTNIFRFYPKIGVYDECNVDKTGQYTVILEDVGTPNDEANRIFDNTTGIEVTRKNGPTGTLGHMDCGYGYCVGLDNNGTEPLPQTSTRYNFPAATPTTVVHYNVDPPPTPPVWEMDMLEHVSHVNAVPTATRSLANQYVCGSQASASLNFANEVTCVRASGGAPLEQLIVAPVMTRMASGFGGYWKNAEYGQQPKGHLDVTGRYFLWTTNLEGSRLDAFVVEVPGHLLVTFDTTAPAPPAGLSLQ